MTTCFKTVTSDDGIPLEVLRERLAQLDLSPIKFKLMDAKDGLGWSRQHADEIERHYRNFLMLAGSEPDRAAVPFGAVDEMWHYHILDTEKYAADCDMLFGHFLHHFPYLGMRGEEDAALLKKVGAATQTRYHKLFGERMAGASQTCEGKWCCGGFGNAKVSESLRMNERPTC